MTDILIIGAGPAGLTAAIYALRAGAKVTILEANIYGGQAAITDKIENYPAIEVISGMELAERMHEQVRKMGANLIFEKVRKVNLTGEKKTIHTKTKEIQAKTVIIANGLKRRVLGCKGEAEFTGRGVSYCATCDGAFFKDKNVMVVGGGNSALEDALYLSKICANVSLVVRKKFFKGEKHLINLVEQAKNISAKMCCNLIEIKGSSKVEAAVLGYENFEEIVPVDGIFVAIGYSPQNDIYKGQVEMDEKGYFTASEDCKTNLKGVYVAGDCRVKPLRQIVTAAADGAVAGNAAARILF